MNQLLDLLNRMPEYRRLLEKIESSSVVGVSGAPQLVRSHFIAGLSAQTKKPILVICQDDMAAKRAADELKLMLEQEIPVLPGRDLALIDAAVVSHAWEQRRLKQLYALKSGKTRVQVTSWDALAQRTMPPALMEQSVISLAAGGSYDLEELTRRLTHCGYTRCDMVEGVGQFSLRGGILDVYSPASESPIRIEFFGDEVDAMGFFDPMTQRRTENIDQIELLPVAETLTCLHPGGTEGLAADLSSVISHQKRRKIINQQLILTLESDRNKLLSGVSFPAADRYMALIYPEFACAVDYVPQDAVIVFCDHGNLRRAARGGQDHLALQLDSLLQSGQLVGTLCDFVRSWDDLCYSLKGRPVAFLDDFAAAYPECLPPKDLVSITAKQLPGYGGSLDTAVGDLQHYQRQDFGALVLCGSRQRAELLQQMLREKGVSGFLAFPLTALPKPGQILLADGSLPGGVEYPAIGLAILTEGQLMARQVPKARKKAPTNRQKLNSFTDLTPGDLIVHEQYGIGRYVCMEQIKVDGSVKDYVKIAYQGTDVLYVPASQMDLISKYIGGGEDTPIKLSKIGSDAWQKTKAKARKAAKDMAGELIKLYAERKRQPGYAFAADTPWQQEFESNFPYLETDDQLRCISEIKSDMESPTPMDRLLCGDVGFGKTEVALRAAMKAILDSKQVAILVPTTVLAQQHYMTAVSRFAGFPVNIDVLSRFRTPAQQRKTLMDVKSVTVDLVIGTHKLLQKSLTFKNLGLLIVDEEQRFGVSHKERLKELSKGVDVLTLSATPIPRTLNMALSGIRDMSTIEEPPHDRYPVQTFVMEYAEPVIDDAIIRELERGGQVYYLHNRVETIDQCALKLRKRLPNVQVAVAHGKMNEDDLGEIMQRLTEGEIQVLVCTTIIETGIDIPNVNTLIIENADRLGLAQLHQLRGRVGRANRRAFAYLTFQTNRVLSEQAEKRLGAIREFAEFGSGFKIAMRDLEIRGAGNLLGAEQSGHMMSVGYDMYLKLLEEAVLEEQGQAPKQPECTADLNVTANVDKQYVQSGEQRMDLYRRMAAIRNDQEAEDLLDEIIDRFGEPPIGVVNLVSIALLRAKAAACGITDIRQREGEIAFTLLELDVRSIGAVCNEAAYKNRIFVDAKAKAPTIRLKLLKGQDPLRQSEKFTELLTLAKEQVKKN